MTLNSAASDKNHTGGVVLFFENHAQDARVRRIRDGVAQTLGSSNANSVGVSGNNPLVLSIGVCHSSRYQDGGVV